MESDLDCLSSPGRPITRTGDRVSRPPPQARHQSSADYAEEGKGAWGECANLGKMPLSQYGVRCDGQAVNDALSFTKSYHSIGPDVIEDVPGPTLPPYPQRSDDLHQRPLTAVISL